MFSYRGNSVIEVFSYQKCILAFKLTNVRLSRYYCISILIYITKVQGSSHAVDSVINAHIKDSVKLKVPTLQTNTPTNN